MSLYADYLNERTDIKIIEGSDGFATYRYLNDRQVYIIDIYVPPDIRKKGAAAGMADEICEEARARGCTELIGSVDITAKTAKVSLAVLFAYGMDLVSCNNNGIILRKGL